MIRALPVSEADRESLRARERVTDDSDLFFRVCPYCASSTWMQTNQKGTARVFCTLETDRICASCETFSFRHPDVFRWVGMVISAQKLIEAALAASQSSGKAGT